MKDPSSQDYKDLVSTMSMLSTYRIDAEEFVASWMSGYDYSVGQVTVTGNTATVEVTITIKQMGPIMDEWFAEISTLTQREDLTEDFDVYGEAGKSLTALMAAAKPTSTTILLDCTLQGDTWIIAQDDTELMKALMGESTFLNL